MSSFSAQKSFLCICLLALACAVPSSAFAHPHLQSHMHLEGWLLAGLVVAHLFLLCLTGRLRLWKRL